jgi:hypothetical protein
MSKANCMSRLLRNPRRLILLCAPMVLAGCQSPLAPPLAAPPPPSINQALADTTPVLFFDDAMLIPASDAYEQPAVKETTASQIPKPNDAAPAEGNQKQSAGLTGQLADSLMTVFKTFTGR